MTEEQNKEVMRLADEIADYAWREGVSDGAYTNAKDDRECRADSRTELEAYLRTIWIASQASNTFPINPNGASKWAHLQKHDGAEAIGVVFRTGSGSVGSLVDGRVVWADWLAHPNGSKPEGVNAEMLEALKECMKWQAEGEFGDPLSEEYWSPAYKEFMGKTKEAIARAESAIETPAKVSPCAGHAVQQDADASCDWPEDFPHENGQYMNTCHVCKNTFIGHKRRVVCKVCNNGFIRAQQEADEAGGA